MNPKKYVSFIELCKNVFMNEADQCVSVCCVSVSLYTYNIPKYVMKLYLWHIDSHLSHRTGFDLSHCQPQVRGRDLYPVHHLDIRESRSGS